MIFCRFPFARIRTEICKITLHREITNGSRPLLFFFHKSTLTRCSYFCTNPGTVLLNWKLKCEGWEKLNFILFLWVEKQKSRRLIVGCISRFIYYVFIGELLWGTAGPKKSEQQPAHVDYHLILVKYSKWSEFFVG